MRKLPFVIVVIVTALSANISEVSLTAEPVDAGRDAGRLVEEGGKSVEKASQLLETLGERIEQFGKSLAAEIP